MSLFLFLQDPGDKKKKKEKDEEEEDDSEDTLDWWSRYYETMKFIDADAEDKKKEEKKKKEKKEQEKEGRDDKKDKKDKKKEKNVQPEVSKRPERKKNIPLIEVNSNLLLFNLSLFQALGFQHSVGTNFGFRVQGTLMGTITA